MSIQQAEQLKQEWTDKYVVVRDGIPELRRFSGLVGQVKTVNMNCQALVQFAGNEDIAWYDISPTCLKITDKPTPTAKPAEKPATVDKPAATGKPAAKPSGKTPLEMARAQDGAKSASGDKKLSPLELARQQDAKKTSGAAPAAAAAGKKLSPLELARMQDSKKAGATAPAPEAPAADEPTESAAVADAAPTSAAEPNAAEPGGGRAKTPGSTSEILELARRQGPFRG